MDAKKRLPLAGLRVADFSWLIAGPYATALLAQLGAEVIKIESRARPDDIRLTMPFKDGQHGLDRSLFFMMTNVSKRSVCIDLNKPRGAELARRIVAASDIVVENFRPGQMERWGLGYEQLKEVNPGIVMLRVSVHGQDGPYARQPMVGIFLQGAAGFHNLVGWPDRDPAGIPSAYTDYVVPWFVGAGALSGLEYRRRTGSGLEIDVSQIEVAPHFLAPLILDYTANGRIAERAGNRSWRAAPNGVYRCRGEDRWCAISICDHAQWRALAAAVGEPALGDDPRFLTQASRAAQQDELDRTIERWTAQRPPEEAVALLQQAGVPAAIVATSEDIMEHDPQIKEREAFKFVQHPEIGEYRAQGVPFRLSKGGSETRAAPTLGQDTEYVCCEILGLSDDEFASLVADEVFS